MGKRFCFIVICCVFGYMDILAQSVLPDSVAVVYVDSLKLWEERMLSTDGRLYSVTHYSDSLLTKQEGTETYFFSNGTVKSTAMYRNGELSDTVQAWYYDRSVKRRDVYENGRLVEGVCYGPRGGTLTHTDYRKDTEYKGGIPALYSIIAINAQKVVLPDDEPAKQGKVIVRLSIDKRGRVYDKHVVQSLHPLYDAEVLRICEHLEQFEPALRDGEAVPCFYMLTVLF